ncbi:MAG: DUF169 domain-containing protein [Deltaproteobacteria bacterium]|nr:DUF169 domain-containing protein [Deltaproteobacteria bacterium]
MLNVNELNTQAVEIESVLRMKTKPLAVKMLEKEEDIPRGAKRPIKDLGCHLSLCQAVSLARRQGMSIAELKEDMWCFEPVLGLGMAEAPEYFLEGHNRYPGTASTLEAGRNWAQAFPRLEAGKYIGIAVAPLASADFVPDLFILYTDSSQLTQLLIAKNWMDGRDITSTLSGHAACVYTIVPVLKSGQFQVAVPCFGDRRRGMASDEEIIFSGPCTLLGGLLAGLKHIKEAGEGLPLPHLMLTEYKLRDSYVKIGKMIGMDL